MYFCKKMKTAFICKRNIAMRGNRASRKVGYHRTCNVCFIEAFRKLTQANCIDMP